LLHQPIDQEHVLTWSPCVHMVIPKWVCGIRIRRVILGKFQNLRKVE
jgi:hypothetical protein